MFGGNGSSYMKLKPFLVYHSEKPRTLKNIAKDSLPVVWKSNPKACVAQTIFQDWFFHHFILEVDKYCLEKDVPFNILLLLNSAPGPVHGRLSCQRQSSASAIKYYVSQHGPGTYSDFQNYYLCYTFCQAVKESDESGTVLQQFWKDYNIYKAINTIDCAA